MIPPCIEKVTSIWDSHPPVGTFIGVLAVIGILFPLLREWAKIVRWEKTVWTFVMFALLGLELRTLYKDRDEHDAAQELARCQQVQSFEGIVGKLQESVLLSQSQYRSTVSHVDEVLTKTERLAELSKNNLDNITGGDSYAYVYPSRMLEGNDAVTLNVHNDGKQSLTGVVVTVRRVVSGSPDPMEEGASSKPLILDLSPPVPIGSLAPQEGRMVPGMTFRPVLDLDGIGRYSIYVNAQNPGTAEILYFRQSKSGRSWDYRLVAWKPVTGKHKPGDDHSKNEDKWLRYVKKTGWIEPRVGFEKPVPKYGIQY